MRRVMLLSLMLVARAASGAGLDTLVSDGKAGLDLRYRYESVEQSDRPATAEANTLRLRLNLASGAVGGFSGFAEFDHVQVVGDEHYDSTRNGLTRYPVVADPEGTDLNQAYLQYAGPAGTTLRLGRQRIRLDGERFIGPVGWRQNEQTYDAATFRQQTGGGLDIQLAYVWQVNRIFGDDVPAGRNDGNTWLANLAREWKDFGKLTGYYYDIDNDDVSSFSTQTYGARFAGTRKLNSVGLGYAFEYARQNDAHRNTVDYSANYYRADLSLAFALLTPYIGYESLEGDDTRAGASFRTPLATLHAFNGWADVFLTTPNEGLNDFFGGVKGKAGAWNWDLLYHDFQAESGSDNFGEEVDAAISRKFAEKYGVLFKAAWFNADNTAPYYDTTKLWVQLSADF